MSISKATTVDVIIPTYNGMPYLEETVKSILDQDHKKLKLYVIDDGSKDDGLTETFVKSLKDKRVHYFRQKNGGQAKARNTGIKISNSPLIAFCDADDLWRNNKLSRQIEIIMRSPNLGLVYGSIDVVDKDKKYIRSIKAKYRGNIFPDLLEGNCIAGSASMALISRAALNDVGNFREDLMIGEDWELWLRLAKKYEFDYAHDVLADLRSLDDGMQQNWEKMASGLTFMLPIMISELSLKRNEKRILTASCMWQASHYYYFNKQHIKAIDCMTRCLIANPLYFGDKERYFSILSIYFSRRVANILTRIFRKINSEYYKRIRNNP